ncbi:hypothetical protein [Hyphomicrobium sp.]|uniref:hypothetical protein n=1 Tax=Hyphomicrobium sp. TaxID=82 RepID=UPI000F9FC5FF|nr:hypothetical protein [Hyphomicrobium sp.]RUP07825.1 MAG: hypothetical protein EKK38_17755 [Hyphomicrobium sp.]
MGNFDYRYHLRLDEATERALNQICRCTFMSKSTLMRHYIQQGVARDIKLLASQIDSVVRSSAKVDAIAPENSDSSLFGYDDGLDPSD